MSYRSRGGYDSSSRGGGSRGGGRVGGGRRGGGGGGGGRSRDAHRGDGYGLGANGDDVMRVSKDSEMARTAGAIAWRARESSAIIIEAAGPTCINIAAKALCIARSMLVEDDIDIKCTPQFYSPAEDSGDKTTLNTVMRIFVASQKAQPPHETTGSLVRASPMSDPKKVAGAIANNVRQKQACAVSAGGRISINVAIKAVAIARSYLEAEGIDLYFQPYFPDPNSSEVHCVIHERAIKK